MDEYLQRAIELSKQCLSNSTGGPFGAVVVKDGVMIGEGVNQVTLINDPTAHAEIQAIRQACETLKTFLLKGSVLYTSCEPCPMCLSAIYWARIDKVIYAAAGNDAAQAGFIDDFIVNELDKPQDQRALKIIHATEQRQDAIAVLEAWKKLEDKIEY